MPPVNRYALFAVAGALQIAVRVGLRLAGLPRVVAAARRTGRVFRAPMDDDSIAWALAASSSRVGGNCLTRAVAGRVLTEWAGSPAAVVVGVRRQGAGLQFHAWLEPSCGGSPADAAGFLPVKAWS